MAGLVFVTKPIVSPSEVESDIRRLLIGCYYSENPILSNAGKTFFFFCKYTYHTPTVSENIGEVLVEYPCSVQTANSVCTFIIKQTKCGEEARQKRRALESSMRLDLVGSFHSAKNKLHWVRWISLSQHPRLGRALSNPYI